MTITELTKSALESYFDRLWPICRSITGNGLRESFEILKELMPLELTEVPTGTQVFDWTIPKEWNITDAYIITPAGKKLCDFKVNNLHIVNYSVPVNRDISLDELKEHLHYIKELPEAIPYITSYYKETWGFCMSYFDFENLEEGIYKVFIDSTLESGSLTYGHLLLPGETEDEVMFSSYLCHPSMANNELSGPLTLAFLYKQIEAVKNRRFTYRFILAPETVGVIACLAAHGEMMRKNMKAGYVLTCCGNEAPFVYKRSKQANSLADRVAEHVLKHQDIPFNVIDFSVGGSDERQYCSPGFNLPVGSMTRSMYQRYLQYHTSLDDKSFISFEAMEKSIAVYFKFVLAIELNNNYYNKIQFCEPQLGKRGLYPSSASPLDDRREQVHRMMHLLTYSDGKTSLLEIAEKRQEPVFLYQAIIKDCIEAGVLE